MRVPPPRRRLPAARRASPWPAAGMPPPIALLSLAFLLGGCDPLVTATTAFTAANVASVTVLGRAVPDIGVSLVTGRNCSIVHFEKGAPYCLPLQPLPKPPEFCSRSLGTVDCWIDPSLLPDHPRPVADGPATLTPAQERDRTHPWVDFGF